MSGGRGGGGGVKTTVHFKSWKRVQNYRKCIKLSLKGPLFVCVTWSFAPLQHWSWSWDDQGQAGCKQGEVCEVIYKQQHWKKSTGQPSSLTPWKSSKQKQVHQKSSLAHYLSVGRAHLNGKLSHQSSLVNLLALPQPWQLLMERLTNNIVTNIVSKHLQFALLYFSDLQHRFITVIT